MTPHKHAELIKAWADGAQIQYYIQGKDEWEDLENPMWSAKGEYRIKPEPVVTYGYHGIGVYQGFTHTTGTYSCPEHVPSEFGARAGKWRTVGIIEVEFVGDVPTNAKLV